MRKALKKKLDSLLNIFEHEYINIAVQFYEVETNPITPGISPVPTGANSPIYGGVWSTIKEQFVFDQPPAPPIRLPLNHDQFEYVMCDDANTLLIGGRASGKSSASGAKLIRFALEKPNSKCLLLTPKFKQARAIFDYIRKMLPDYFFLDYKWQRDQKYCLFTTRFMLQPVTGVQEGDARSDSAEIGYLDEIQKIGDDRREAFIPSIRAPGKDPILSGAGTLSVRLKNMVDLWKEQDMKFRMFEVTPDSNPWLTPGVHALTKASMSMQAYEIEIRNNWGMLEQIEEDEHPIVFPSFGTRNLINMATCEWLDITQRFISNRFKVRGKSHLAVIDYGGRYPNYALFFKFLKRNNSTILVANDIIIQYGSAEYLARRMKEKYPPATTLVIDDQSGAPEKNNPSYEQSTGELAPRQWIEKAGYNVWKPPNKCNPSVKDSIECLHGLIDPASGADPRFYVSTDMQGEYKIELKSGRVKFFPNLYNCLTDHYRWGNSDSVIYKPRGNDQTHAPDCCRYAAWYSLPPDDSIKRRPPTLRPVVSNTVPNGMRNR